MKNLLRLKDLDNISSNEPDYQIIMKEVIGYKGGKFLKKYFFVKAFKEAHSLINSARQVNPSKVLYIDGCTINKPSHIDNISFRAMMELQSLINNYNEGECFGKYIAKIITITCYNKTYSGDYSSNNLKFKTLYNTILNKPIWEMFGLYNWIEKSLHGSQIEWNKRFFSVQVEDKDYEQAGGQRMDQFNVINTIKNICSDFNVDYDKAWQMSYALTQTNSYSKATANYTQDQMRQIKESRMKYNKD